MISYGRVANDEPWIYEYLYNNIFNLLHCKFLFGFSPTENMKRMLFVSIDSISTTIDWPIQKSPLCRVERILGDPPREIGQLLGVWRPRHNKSASLTAVARSSIRTQNRSAMDCRGGSSFRPPSPARDFPSFFFDRIIHTATKVLRCSVRQWQQKSPLFAALLCKLFFCAVFYRFKYTSN